jgi:hypothetical protein
VPEISGFLGLIVAIFYNDHAPPHFHVKYGSHGALIGIENLAVIGGQLPPRALGLAIEWARAHQNELRADWQLARQMAPPLRIPPLE